MTATATIDGLTIGLEAEGVAVGVVVARGCTTGPSPSGLDEALHKAIAEAKVRTGEEEVTKPVRAMLRHGIYKPTGRGKPASEYLLKAARGDAFPRINNLVDLNNLVSLRALLPISLVDLGRAEATRFAIRRGRPDESYVFNTAGQRIDLQDLLLVARGEADEPCANPVKDSMATKLDAQATDVMAVLYAPEGLPGYLQMASAEFAEGFRRWGAAASVETVFLPVSL